MKDCNQCGKCCTKYSNGSLSASKSELMYWENFREDIFDYVNNNNIWMDPVTGKQIELCPWLRQLPNQDKYICDIYEDRPEDCRQYPVTIEQMIKDDCEMLEDKDLIKPKHAQKELDMIMIDNRMPVE